MSRKHCLKAIWVLLFHLYATSGDCEYQLLTADCERLTGLLVNTQSRLSVVKDFAPVANRCSLSFTQNGGRAARLSIFPELILEFFPVRSISRT